MKLRDALAAAVCLFILSACDFTGGGGGGGGTGGGTGSFNFAEGFAFVHRDDRNVYVADKSDFQTSATLTTGAGISTPSLSKDGRKIVFVRKNGAATELAIVPASGGAASVVLSTATMPTGSTNLRLPSFSPDGTTLTFAYDENGVGAIGLVNADASQFRKLVGGSPLAYGSPSFSPDGLSVVAAAGTPGSALTQLERITVGSATPSTITNDLTAAGAMDVANRVLVSPDGAKAVFDGHVSTGSTRVFVIDLVTRVVVKVYESNEAGTNDSFPCWVAGGKVAFSTDSGGNDNVYSVNADPALGAALQLLVPKAIEPSYGPR